jgi:class 3 adenylate cyclase/tetratricopeptide (TPR) repeat protein
MLACPKCNARSPDDAHFCPACGAALNKTEARETRKTITVLFCDVKGSTGLGERLQPETFRNVLKRYFETAKPALEAHEGTVYRQIGDGILAAFGVPKLHEDDALRAVRAAVEMRDALTTLNQELEQQWGVRIEARIAINTGEVAVEEDRQVQPTLLGDVLNVASRLEGKAGPGEIILGAATWWLVRSSVSVESLGPLPLRGRSEPVPAYRLTGLSPPSDETQRFGVEMVGRHQEMALLQLLYERIRRERTCHLVTVLGPAGIGKSRLIAEFCSTINDQATVVRGRCLPYGEGITFWPIAVALRQAAGIAADDSPETARARLAALIGKHEHSEQITAQVTQVLGFAEPGTGAEETSFWGLRRLLEILAERRPIILVVEDLHWAEPTLLDLIEHVADRSREAPILLICLARDMLLEDRPTWGGGKLNATSILLSPLDDAASAQLTSQLLGSTPLTARASATIAEIAEGNPLFIEELVATVRDDERGLAAVMATAGRGVSEGSVPLGIQAVLATRLERLKPEERSVLERAAVVGVHFSKAAVLGLSDDMSDEQITSILDVLVRKELIRPYRSDLLPTEGFRFRHGLIKDTTYAAIPLGTRAILHERLADLGERTFGDRAREIDAIIIARDLSEAYRYRTELGPPDERTLQLAQRGGELLSAVGRRASLRGDVPATISSLSRALDLLPEGHPLKLETLIMLAEGLRSAGKLTEAAAKLDVAIQTATKAKDLGQVARVEIGRLDLDWYTDLEAMLNDGAAKAERAIQVLEAHGDDSGLVGSWKVLAHILQGRGRNKAAHEAIERAIDAARRAADNRLEATALSSACWIALHGARPLVDVIAYIESILDWADRTGSPRLEAHAMRVLARAYAMRDDFNKARELLGAANTIMSRLGEVLRASPDANAQGFIELLARDYTAAEAALRRSFTMLAGFGTKNQSAAVAGLLARVLLAQNRVTEAEYFTKISRRNAATKDVDAQVKWRRAQARISASRSRFAYAERLARQEVALADETDWLDLQAESRMDLAHVLQLAGRSRDAREAAEAALGRYRRKGNLVGVRVAQEFLDGLA